jgi:hypothetical protein
VPPTTIINQIRKSTVETKIENQFQAATSSLERLLYSLPDNKDIFTKFGTVFLD